MDEVSRRGFLVQASVVGAAAAATGMAASPLLHSKRTTRPETPLPESLVVHVRDLVSAEVAVLAGTEEIVYHDEQLVASLLNAIAKRDGGQ